MAGPELIVDLGSVARNWMTVRRFVKPGAEVGAVVKANAYGTGQAAIVDLLLEFGCRSLFVSSCLEGAALRMQAPHSDIYVLSEVVSRRMRDLQSLRLIPVLNNMFDLRRWLSTCRGARFAIHFDTGLNRLGISHRDASCVADHVRHERVRPELIISHLACADDPSSELNEVQRQRFLRIQAAFPGVRTSLAASKGTFLGPAFHFDLVRLGSALFGISPQFPTVSPLVPALQLRATVLHVFRVKRGEPVGYGPLHRVDGSRTRLAVVGMGYHDAPISECRLAPSFHLGSARFPLVGKVSMDCCTVDVTKAPKNTVNVGSYLDLVSHEVKLDTVSRTFSHMPQSFLAGIGARVARTYRGVGRAAGTPPVP